jgi:hypothetical protein
VTKHLRNIEFQVGDRVGWSSSAGTVISINKKENTMTIDWDGADAHIATYKIGTFDIQEEWNHTLKAFSTNKYKVLPLDKRILR